MSGQAAVAVTMDAPRYLYALDCDPVPAAANGDAWRVFDGCLDVQEIKVEKDGVLPALERAWALDRCLRLFMFLIDPQEPEEFLPEYAECVEELLTQLSCEEDILPRLSNTPFPLIIEIKRIREAAARAPKVLVLFERVLNLQGHIRRVHGAFESLSDGFFDSEIARQRFYNALQAEGAFGELAMTLEQGADISFLKLKLAHNHLPDREAVSQWTAMLQSGTARRKGRVYEEEADVDDHDWEVQSDAKRQPSHQTYQYVRTQQVEIVQHIKLRELDKARARTSELVEKQRPNSTTEQIAKTLSLLSQEAKQQDVPELQLEWAKQATFENPADPKTYGHLSDALIILGRFTEAEEALSSAERVGGRLFAEGGRARILRALGRFEEARSKYISAAQEFNDFPEVEYAWMGAADTLRDMGHVDEAIAEYRELTNRWPLNIHLWGGYAYALLDAGRIDEAITTFGKSAAQGPNKIASNGRAHALRQSGRLSEAMSIYDQVIENYPNDQFALCGRAEILRLKGQYQLALAAYDLAAVRSPYISAPLLGRAAALSDVGSTEEALRLYEDIQARFPNEPGAGLEMIRLLRRKGDLDQALRHADDLIVRMPHLVAAKIARAQILQSFGQFDAALTALDVVTSQYPFNATAVSVKANLLIAMGRMGDAERLLPYGTPKTQAEWSRFMLRVLIVQDRNGLGAASAQLEWAISKCPFFAQRRSLRNTLTSLELRRRRWREARRVVESAPAEVSDVIALHAFAASNRPGHARRIFERIQATETSATVISLAEEIAKRTQLIDGEPHHTLDWIAHSERILILAEAA